MAVSPFKTFSGGEILTASDLNSSFTQITDNGEDLGWPATKAKDLNGQSLTLDADGDTSITASTDDQIDFQLGGTDLFRMKTVASAVNGLDFLASATGNDVDIVAFGTDTNIDIQFSPKGSGDIFKDSNLIFHAGNDGAGSGLDADLLDGVQGASYARSDAADTISAVQTHSARPAFESSGAPFTVSSSTVVSGLNADLLDGITSGSFARSDATDTISAVQTHTARPAFNSTGAPFTVNSSTVVSGLNADQLDGISSASFLRSDATDTVSAVQTHTARPAFNSTGAPFTVNSNTVVTNLNADLLDGISGGSFARSDAADTISGVLTHTARPVFNGGTSGSSSPFTVDSTQVVTNLNADLLDGNSASAFLGVSAKAADSELLDGVNGASFARSDTADTISGVLTHTARPVFNGGLSGSTSPFTVDSTQVVTNLNADLLDGISSGSFARSDAADTISGVLTHTARPAFNSTGAPFTVTSTTKVTNLNADQLDGSSASAFLGVSAKAADSQLLDGIDSTGFLLVGAKAADSELLDGVNSTSFLRSDAADTKTSGNLRLNDNIVLEIGTGDDASLYFNGSDLFLDIISTAGVDFFIRDGTTSRYLFNKDEGEFHADGDVIANSTSVGSDPRYKKNIKRLENSLEKVLQLNGYSFTMKKDGRDSAGVLSTEVKKVLPSAVRDVKCLGELEGKTREHVNYNQLIGLLIEAVKELDARVSQ